MEQEALKAFMYGALNELIKNRRYYHHSTVGMSYSHWTDEGQKALSDFMSIIAYKMIEADDASINKRAKELVINGLKGEKV
jgi:hypothetical protein